MATRLLRIKVAEAEYGISERALREMVAKKLIPYVKVGRSVYLERLDIEKLIGRGKQPAA